MTLASLTPSAFAQTPSIVIDGNVADWAGIAPLIIDPEGDGPLPRSASLSTAFFLIDGETLVAWD